MPIGSMCLLYSGKRDILISSACKIKVKPKENNSKSVYGAFSVHVQIMCIHLQYNPSGHTFYFIISTNNNKIGCKHTLGLIIKLQLSIKLLTVLSIGGEEYNYFIQYNYWTECPWQWQ